MDRLWAADGPQSVRDVLFQLQAEREIAYNTVKTVMERLHRKRLLDRLKSGKAFLYTPTRTRAEFTASLMVDVLGASHDRTAALVHFADQMTPREVTTLMQVLAVRRGSPPPSP